MTKKKKRLVTFKQFETGCVTHVRPSIFVQYINIYYY